jgi:hypothetical protein
MVPLYAGSPGLGRGQGGKIPGRAVKNS